MDVFEAWAGAMLHRIRRPLRDALILVGIGRALYYYLVQGVYPWTFIGLDARAYWRIDLAHPYAASGVGEISTYLYSPAFAQVLAPFSLLPFEVFFALWTVMNIALLVWLVRPWPWVVPMLILPISYELLVGNIHFLLAAACVVGVRRAGTWSFPVLTKVTPGVAALWFLGRGRWRSFATAVGVTLVLAAVSFVLAPAAWSDWIAFLLSNPGVAQWLPVRLVAAALIVLVGARRGWAWTIAVAAWIAVPVVWVNAWVVLLGTIRLARVRVGKPGGAAVQPDAALATDAAPVTAPVPPRPDRASA